VPAVWLPHAVDAIGEVLFRRWILRCCGRAAPRCASVASYRAIRGRGARSFVAKTCSWRIGSSRRR